MIAQRDAKASSSSRAPRTVTASAPMAFSVLSVKRSTKDGTISLAASLALTRTSSRLRAASPIGCGRAPHSHPRTSSPRAPSSARSGHGAPASAPPLKLRAPLRIVATLYVEGGKSSPHDQRSLSFEGRPPKMGVDGTCTMIAKIENVIDNTVL